MRILFIMMAILASGCAITAQPADITPTITWQAPTHNTDEQEINPDSLLTYNVYLVEADVQGNVTRAIRPLGAVKVANPFQSKQSFTPETPIPWGSKIAVTVTASDGTSDYSKAVTYYQ